MLSHSLVRWGALLGLTMATYSCTGTVLDVGSGGDAGRDACTPSTCRAGEAWDPLLCTCVPTHASCSPPSSCPTGLIFDDVQCACIANPTKPPPGHPQDAGNPPRDAGLPDSDIDPCGDISPTCCVLSDAGCTLGSSPANGDPCSGWTCSNGGMQIQGSCPTWCVAEGDAGGPCMTASDCAAGQVCFNNDPLQTPTGTCVSNPCGSSPLSCGCASSLCNGITMGLGACEVGDGGLVSCLNGG
jgi:hypothetical protein